MKAWGVNIKMFFPSKFNIQYDFRCMFGRERSVRRSGAGYGN